jgi:hypothetical protein
VPVFDANLAQEDEIGVGIFERQLCEQRSDLLPTHCWTSQIDNKDAVGSFKFDFRPPEVLACERQNNVAWVCRA